MEKPIIGDAPMIWITADKRAIPITEMETTHIQNSIAKIRRSIRIDANGKPKGWRLNLLKPLRDELKRRGSNPDVGLNPSKLTNRFHNLDID